MSKCIQCGAALPPVGECAVCQARAAQARPTPALLDRELKLDRRQGQREPGAAPEPAAGARPSAGMTALSEPLGLRPEPSLSGVFPRATRAPGSAPAPAAAPRPAAPQQVAPPHMTPQQRAPNQVAAHPPPPAAPPRAPAAPHAAPPRPPPGAMAASPRPAAPPAAPAAPMAAAPMAAAPMAAAPMAAGPAVAAPRPPAPPRGELGPPPGGVPGGPGVVHARPAPLWRRCLAGLVDGTLVVGVAALYLAVAGSITGAKPGPAASTLDAVVERAHALQAALLPGFVLLLLLSMVYAAWGAMSGGRTLGRRLAGIRLVDARGLAPTPARAVVRAVLSGVSFLLFFAGFWLALFDRKGQTLHDKLASTFVIHPS